MSLSTGAAIVSVWLLGVGLIAVHMEVRNVGTGVRIRRLLKEEETLVEKLRELELEYHARIYPDELEEELPPAFRTHEGFPDDGRPVYGPWTPATRADGQLPQGRTDGREDIE